MLWSCPISYVFLNKVFFLLKILLFSFQSHGWGIAYTTFPPGDNPRLPMVAPISRGIVSTHSSSSKGRRDPSLSSPRSYDETGMRAAVDFRFESNLASTLSIP
jgi:hypothetical protein